MDIIKTHGGNGNSGLWSLCNTHHFQGPGRRQRRERREVQEAGTEGDNNPSPGKLSRPEEVRAGLHGRSSQCRIDSEKIGLGRLPLEDPGNCESVHDTG